MTQLKDKLRELRELTEALYRDFGLRCEYTLSDTKDTLLPETSSAPKEADTSGSSADETSVIESTFKTIDIDPSNSSEVDEYLIQCFDEFQQIPCKLLAKAWIRLIEPKKQSRYPYKLGDRSKPLWWPESCRHKEPDHLRKEERIDLLVCIVKTFRFQAKDLIATAESVGEFSIAHGEHTAVSRLSRRKLDILIEMFKVLNAAPGSGPVTVSKPGKKYSSKVYTKKVLQRRLESEQRENIPPEKHRLPPKTPSPRRVLGTPLIPSNTRQTSTPEMSFQNHDFGHENIEPSLASRNPLSLLTPNNFNLLLLYGPSSTDFGGLFQANENTRPAQRATYFQRVDQFDSDETVSDC
ncbi:hypothetical protein KL929_002478 [Ogataea haglerorum]|nr:hypothetical protein KL929_002478 [Ogataea haglerorum]